MTILKKTDFIGRYLISFNGINDAHLDNLIEQIEENYLRLLFGAVMYDEYKVLDSENLPEEWEDAIDGNNFTYCGETYYFKGLRDMLKPILWALFHQQQRQVSKPTGLSRPEAENAETLINADFGMIMASYYNEGISIYDMAITYFRMNAELFENFKPSEINKISW